MRTYIYVLLFLMFLPLLTVAQKFNITYFSVEEGLTQADVLSLHQDKTGNLWIGTMGGVNIFNGKEFTYLTEEDGLPSNVVYDIIEDDNGRMIFGTAKGLSVWDGKTFANYSAESVGLHDWVFSLAKDLSGNIWLATNGGIGIFKNNELTAYSKCEDLINAKTYTIFADSRGNILVGTQKIGVVIFTPDKEGKKIISTEDGLYHNYIRSIAEDASGNIWIGSWNGVDIYNPETDKLTKIDKTDPNSPGTIGAITLSKTKEVIAIRYNRYVSWYNKPNSVSDVIDFKGHLLWTGIEDIEGNLWIGTKGRGLMKLQNRTFYNYNEADNTLHNDNVFAICKKDDTTYYIGCTSKGVAELKVKARDASYKNITFDENGELQFAGSYVTSLAKDKEGRIWVGTYEGLTLINDTGFVNFSLLSRKSTRDPVINPKLCSERVRSLFVDSDGKIWVGTDNGITTIKDTTFENLDERYPDLKSKSIWSITKDQNKNYWLALDTGVCVIRKGRLEFYNGNKGFTNSRVAKVVEDYSGNLWFGTKEGLFNYNGKEFKRFSDADGLANNNIYLLVIGDKENLFIGTSKGIDKLNLKAFHESGVISIRHFGSTEGFLGQECNLNACYKDDDGKIWFGTVKGVTIFDPENETFNEIPPKSVITQIMLAYKVFDWGPYCSGIDSVTNLPVNLVLPYNKNHLTFEFIAPSLSIPGKVKYQYFLKGLNEDWTPPLLKNEADYPSLPPGNYTFKVKACNNDGVWNEIPTEFKFTISPPFWKTWWFLTIVIVLSAALIFAYIKYREASLRKEKIRLEAIVKERTAEVVKQKEIVEQKNKDITDSINYAKNIQSAILPRIEKVKESYPDSFILFKPRDIVSGDFYWFNNDDEHAFFAAADCTGHGVPGAFMSMLGVAFLNEIVNKDGVQEVDEILNRIRNEIISSLNQKGREGEAKDGMDIVLISINKKTNILEYSGANNPLYIIRNNEIIEYKADKMPIGLHIVMPPFTKHTIQLQTGDLLYFFSDGYADQFGGPDDKKFKAKKFKQLLLEIQAKPMEEQKKLLDIAFEDWRTYKMPESVVEQVDDVIVIGVRIT